MSNKSGYLCDVDGTIRHFNKNGIPVSCTMATTNKSARLETNPHYTDSRFDKEQTVFGARCEGLSYDYSDRLFQFDYTKARAAEAAADENGFVRMTCLWYEAYLSSYYDASIEIHHIIAGVNRSNGFSYCAFGYKKKGN